MTLRAQLDTDEAGTTAFLATLPKSAAVPTTEVGHTDTVPSAESSLYDAIYGKKEA